MINPTLNRCFPLFWCAILVQLFCFAHLNAQTVIGGDTIDQSAILDIQDTAKGVLLSRLTTTQRNAIPKPAFGLLILNTTRKCLEANIGSPDTPDWRCLTTGIPKISEVDTAYWNRKLGAGDTLSLSARINAKLSPGDTLSLSNRIDGKLSSFTESDPVFNSSIAKGISGADTLYWNRKLDAGDTLSLSARINAKLSPVDTLSLSNRINSKLSSFTESDPVFNSSIAKGIVGADTLYWNRKLDAGDTVSLSARINAKLSPVDTLSLSNRIDGKLSSFTEGDPVFNSSIAKWITGADTLYWNRKLDAGDTFSLSARINAKLSPVDTLSLSNRIDGKLSSYTESDPVFNSSIAKGITGADTLYWNRKLGAGDTLSLSARINAKLSPVDTLSLSNRIDGKLSGFTENDPVFNSSIAKGITGTDTLYWNRKLGAGDTLSLSARINAKLSPVDTLSLSNRIESKLSNYKESDPVFNSSIAKGITGVDTLYWNRKLGAGDTLSLSARINTKLNPTDTFSLSNRIDGKLSSFTESDPVFNSSVAKGITGADTLYWNRKLSAGDTISLSNRIDSKVGLPQSGNTPGTMLYWSGLEWVKVSPGQPGQALTLSQEGFPVWTGPAMASLTTNSPSSIMQISANVGGIITNDGGSQVTVRGIVWGTNPKPTLSTSDALNLGSGNGTFEGLLTGLLPNTKYYLRAFATNVAGTVYGNEVTILTLPVEIPKVINISGGTFSMGCTQGDVNCENNEFPVHQVTLNGFQMSETEVTQWDWQVLMGENPSNFKSPACPNCPVEWVSWFDAIVYCNRLSEIAGLTPCYYSDAAFSSVYGKSGAEWSLPNSGEVFWNQNSNGYRLPTEAEWEYAARGGNISNIYSGGNNIDALAWYGDNSGLITKPVKGKAANGYGLFDMTGNISEWTWNWWESYTSANKINPIGPVSGLGRVSRGGSAFFIRQGCRVSIRTYHFSNSRNSTVGFRFVKS